MTIPIQPTDLADGRGSSADVFFRMLEDSVDFSTSISFLISAIFASSSAVELIVAVYETTQLVGQVHVDEVVVVVVVDVVAAAVGVVVVVVVVVVDSE